MAIKIGNTTFVDDSAIGKMSLEAFKKTYEKSFGLNTIKMYNLFHKEYDKKHPKKEKETAKKADKLTE